MTLAAKGKKRAPLAERFMGHNRENKGEVQGTKREKVKENSHHISPRKKVHSKIDWAFYLAMCSLLAGSLAFVAEYISFT